MYGSVNSMRAELVNGGRTLLISLNIQCLMQGVIETLYLVYLIFNKVKILQRRLSDNQSLSEPIRALLSRSSYLGFWTKSEQEMTDSKS